MEVLGECYRLGQGYALLQFATEIAREFQENENREHAVYCTSFLTVI